MRGKSLACWFGFYFAELLYCCALGFACSMLVERPLMRFGQALTRVPRRPRDAPTPAASAREQTALLKPGVGAEVPAAAETPA